jgi:ATP-dependent phosphofructokinase / diphosphate-dependent phosphofructokinase
MTGKRQTLVVGQSGGATAVINATLAGVVESAHDTGRFNRVVGMQFSFEGLLNDELIDLTAQDPAIIAGLRNTPSAALGTSRRKLSDDDHTIILEKLRALDAGALVLIGGNDSADGAHRLHLAAKDAGYDLSVILAPKTIDNDLPLTDHCPGYPSLAKYLANAVRDATFDSLATPRLHPVKFIEVMGRDAGWVAASCALGFGETERDLLPLIFLPEEPPVDADSALNDIAARVEERGFCVAIIPETLQDASGRHFGGDTPDYVDAFGHPYFPSAAAAMTRLVQERLGLRSRYERPGTAARMSISLASHIDLDEAYNLGWAAAARAAIGASDIMVTLDRVSDSPYQCALGTAPLSEIANRVRIFPDGFYTSDGRGITDSFRAYALPLLGEQPFPVYARLDVSRRV